MKNVLLPTDFSDNSMVAIEYALNLFGSKDVKYYILNTYQIPHAGASVLVSIEDILHEESKKGLEKVEKTIRSYNNGAEADLEFFAQRGDLPTRANKLCSRFGLDYIVLGTKGASGLKEILLGSNAHHIMLKACCPVIVVPERTEIKPTKVFALSTDISGTSAESISPLLDLINEKKGKLLVVNIIQPGVEEDEIKETTYFQGKLEDYEHALHLVEGEDIINKLGEFTSNKKVDLLTMVRHKHNIIDRIFNTSFTSQMAMNTTLPLLVLKE